MTKGRDAKWERFYNARSNVLIVDAFVILYFPLLLFCALILFNHSFVEQSRRGGAYIHIRLRFVAARAAYQRPHLCPVSSLLLMQVRFPISLCLIAATDTIVPAMHSLLKAPFLRVMLPAIVETDRKRNIVRLRSIVILN